MDVIKEFTQQINDQFKGWEQIYHETAFLRNLIDDGFMDVAEDFIIDLFKNKLLRNDPEMFSKFEEFTSDINQIENAAETLGNLTMLFVKYRFSNRLVVLSLHYDAMLPSPICKLYGRLYEENFDGLAMIQLINEVASLNAGITKKTSLSDTK